MTTKRTAKQASKPKKAGTVRTEPGKSGLTPTFPDRPIGYGNPPRETQIKPGEALNPGGRPKLLGESYTAMLARVNERDPQGRTNAELLAEAAKVEGLKGNVAALREIRSATEGDTIHLATWQNEIIAALKAGKLSAAKVIEELGIDDARTILIAAGQIIPESKPGTEPAGNQPQSHPPNSASQAD